MIDFKHRLIVDYSSLKSVSKILSNGQNELLLVFFTMAILFEFFGEWNFAKVLKRIVICFLILGIFETLFNSSINLSFGISDTLLDQCKKTEFCAHYLTMKKGASTDATLWSETVHVLSNFSTFWLHALVSLIFKIAFVFTIQIYSLVHAITSVTYPLICIIGILPSPGEKAFVSLFQTLLWLFISPIILSVVIVLLASVTEVGMGPKGEVGLEGLLHLMIISLFSLGSLFLSWFLCKGEGVAAFGSKMGQMGTTALAMAGVGGIIGAGKFAGMGLGKMGPRAAGYGGNKLKEYVSNRVSTGIKSKGIEVGASEVANSKNNPINSPIIPRGSEAYRSLSKGEKLLHKVDSVINAKENSLAKQGMIRDFKNIANADSNSSKFKIADYKENARKAMNPKKSSQYSNRSSINQGQKFQANGISPRSSDPKKFTENISGSARTRTFNKPTANNHTTR